MKGGSPLVTIKEHPQDLLPHTHTQMCENICIKDKQNAYCCKTCVPRETTKT